MRRGGGYNAGTEEPPGVPYERNAPNWSGCCRPPGSGPRTTRRGLVLADWLEEYGDDADRARAELIRLQVQLGLPPNTGGRPRR